MKYRLNSIGGVAKRLRPSTDRIRRATVGSALGVALLYCVMLLVFNLLVDISSAWLDPRIRYK